MKVGGGQRLGDGLVPLAPGDDNHVDLAGALVAAIRRSRPLVRLWRRLVLVVYLNFVEDSEAPMGFACA
eukprot:2411502-Pleurochrysis_carterae.AAC.1